MITTILALALLGQAPAPDAQRQLSPGVASPERQRQLLNEINAKNDIRLARVAAKIKADREAEYIAAHIDEDLAKIHAQQSNAKPNPMRLAADQLQAHQVGPLMANQQMLDQQPTPATWLWRPMIMDLLILLVLLLIFWKLFILLILPMKIAKNRNHPARQAILVLNIVGWFLWPLWLIALCWALNGQGTVPSNTGWGQPIQNAHDYGLPG